MNETSNDLNGPDNTNSAIETDNTKDTNASVDANDPDNTKDTNSASDTGERNSSAISVRYLVIAVGLLLVFGVWLLANSKPQVADSVSFEVVGEVAPPVKGVTITGQNFDLQDHRGKWMVVNFFASWCFGCRVEHPELVEFSNRHKDGDVGLVAVMFNDSEKAAREFFAELGGDWPAIAKDTGRIAIDYGVTAVPETVLISPSGRVAGKWASARGVTADEIDEAIATFVDRAQQSGLAGD